jgi:hypothetical protein
MIRRKSMLYRNLRQSVDPGDVRFVDSLVQHSRSDGLVVAGDG